MIIEIVLSLAVIGAVVFLFWKSSKDKVTSDLNQDGKVDIKDVVIAVDKAVDSSVDKVVSKIDVNQDGKVSVEDAKQVMENVKKDFEEKLSESKPTETVTKKTKGKGKSAGTSTEKKPKKPKMKVVK